MGHCKASYENQVVIQYIIFNSCYYILFISQFAIVFIFIEKS